MPEYIVDRYLPKIVTELAEARSIAVKRFSDDWILKLSKDDRTEVIVGYHFSLNNAGAVRVAEDKVATYLLLSDAVFYPNRI